MSTAQRKSEDTGITQIQKKDSRSGKHTGQYVEKKRGRARGTHQLESKIATGQEI
jgi:hypothetical protein